MSLRIRRKILGHWSVGHLEFDKKKTSYFFYGLWKKKTRLATYLFQQVRLDISKVRSNHVFTKNSWMGHGTVTNIVTWFNFLFVLETGEPYVKTQTFLKSVVVQVEEIKYLLVWLRVLPWIRMGTGVLINHRSESMTFYASSLSVQKYNYGNVTSAPFSV